MLLQVQCSLRVRSDAPRAQSAGRSPGAHAPHDTGLCRLPPLSEAPAFTVGRVDLAASVLVLEPLKKRRTGAKNGGGKS